MKKIQTQLTAAGVLVLLIIVTGIVISISNSKPTPKKVTYKPVQACEILTETIAKKYGAKDEVKVNIPDNNSDSVILSSCSYSSSSTKIGVQLLARYPTSKVGSDSNDRQFAKGLPNDAEKVNGYGDAAYWSTRYGQLNILKHHTWYILELGTPKATEHKLADTKKLADQLLSKF